MVTNTYNKTLIDILRFRASFQKEKCGYTFLKDGEYEESNMTYAELDRRAQTIGVLLQKVTVPGERVLLLYPPGLNFITAFFGCLYAGVIAVPVYPPSIARLERTIPRLRGIVHNAQPSIVLTDSSLLRIAEGLAAQDSQFAKIRWYSTDTLVEDSCTPRTQDKQIALLQYTSGSTSAPKGVMVTHTNLLHNCQLIAHAFEHSSNSCGVIWLPPYHDMGLIGGILQPLYVGFPVILMSSVDFLQRPIRWLQAISRYQATTSGGPNFAYDLCARKISSEQRATLDLSQWKVAFNGAEPIHAETLQRFAETFASCGFRQESFYPCYGLAESTLFVTGIAVKSSPIIKDFSKKYLQENYAAESKTNSASNVRLVGCGQSLFDQSLIVADPETRLEQALGQIGEIWVKGPSIAQGYWNNPEATETTFQAKLSNNGIESFLRTGDLGFQYNGELFITGRLKDLIIIRGRNYYPQDIEFTVAQCHPSLRTNCTAAFTIEFNGNENLVVVQEVERQYRKNNVSKVIKNIRQAIAMDHELYVHTIVLVQPGGIPKTSSGKIQRYICKANFLANELKVIDISTVNVDTNVLPNTVITRAMLLAVPPEERQMYIERYLQDTIAHILRIKSSLVDSQRSLIALGFDSLMVIELSHTIEKNLQVVLPIIERFQVANLHQIAASLLIDLEASINTVQEKSDRNDSDTGIYPLSHGQWAIWFIDHMTRGSAAYTIKNAARLKGNLNASSLKWAFQQLVKRHPALRTTFVEREGQPWQQIHDWLEPYFQLKDASSWSVSDLDQCLVREANRPFDLEHGPLLRAYIFKRSEKEHVIFLAVFHLIIDFWSLALLIHELMALYQEKELGRLAMLPPLSMRYTDYVHWQIHLLASSEGERLWEYWRMRLINAPPLLELPTDHPRPLVQTFNGAALTFMISSNLKYELKELSRNHNTTLYTTLLAAFLSLLHLYTRQNIIVVGTPIARRDRAGLAQVIGYLTNVLALCGDISGNPTFSTFLKRIHMSTLEAFSHADYPFDILVQRMHPIRDSSYPPIFQVMFSFHQAYMQEMRDLAPFALNVSGVSLDIHGLQFEAYSIERHTTQLDLTLAGAETTEGLAFSFEYNTDLFEAPTIARLATHFSQVLEAVVTTPHLPISHLPLLTREEHQFLRTLNLGPTLPLPEWGIHHLFEGQVARVPERIAVVYAQEQLTYQQLDRRACLLASYLHSQGVGLGSRVGLCLQRSLDLLPALLALLKAGATYIPLDPTHPSDRLETILREAHASFVVTQTAVEPLFPHFPGQILCLDTLAFSSHASPCQVSVPVPAEHPAYLIYTSGSTGTPKGVLVPHRAVVNLFTSLCQNPGFTEQDTFLAITTLAFDIALLELVFPLTIGGRVHVADQESTTDGFCLAQVLETSGATVLQATPATWSLLCNVGWSNPTQVRALCGGEALPRSLANWLAGIANTWNMYGPTETTVWSATARVQQEEGAPVSLGRPLANTQMYVLDQALQPVPFGVIGEIYLGGRGLATGYYQQPSLTAERFFPHPFALLPGERLYRTGDQARYYPDGTLEFLGRRDQQVKLRGFRIELQEIEMQLQRVPGVQEAVVVVHEDSLERRQLVAYVVLTDLHLSQYDQMLFEDGTVIPQPSVISVLHSYLQAKIPQYMIPAIFVKMDVMPLTPNGKFDRKALPSPKYESMQRTTLLPRTTIEFQLLQVFTRLLSLDQIGIEDDFFEMGGHSLLAAQLLAEINKEFGVHLSLRTIFHQTTVAQLAETIVNRHTKEGHTRLENAFTAYAETWLDPSITPEW